MKVWRLCCWWKSTRIETPNERPMPNIGVAPSVPPSGTYAHFRNFRHVIFEQRQKTVIIRSEVLFLFCSVFAFCVCCYAKCVHCVRSMTARVRLIIIIIIKSAEGQTDRVAVSDDRCIDWPEDDDDARTQDERAWAYISSISRCMSVNTVCL